MKTTKIRRAHRFLLIVLLVAGEGLLADVDLEVLLAVDEEAEDGTALVVAPVVVHVLVEVLLGVEGEAAPDAVHRPVVVLNLVPVLGDFSGGGSRQNVVGIRGGVPFCLDLLLGGGRGPPLLVLRRSLLQ